MKFKNFSLIFLLFSIALPNSQQKELHKHLMNYLKSSMRFEDLILDSLDFLQQKLTNDTFVDEDMRVLYVLIEFVHKMKEKLNELRMRDKTISWLLRQGR